MKQVCERKNFLYSNSVMHICMYVCMYVHTYVIWACSHQKITAKARLAAAHNNAPSALWPKSNPRGLPDRIDVAVVVIFVGEGLDKEAFPFPAVSALSVYLKPKERSAAGSTGRKTRLAHSHFGQIVMGLKKRKLYTGVQLVGSQDG